jgi:hypothetical protein
MPPLTPEQAQKLAEQQKIINDELIRTQSLTEEIFEGNIQITNELKKSIAQANKLNVSFGIGKDISKQVSEERLKNATKIQKIDNDIAVKQAILSKTKSTNQAKQLALEIQDLKTQQRITEQIDAQLRNMESFIEAEKRALELEKERNSVSGFAKEKFKDLSKSFKEMFSVAGIFKIIIDSAFRFNKISTEIGKNLGYSAEKADAVATKFVDIAQNSSNINVTLANLGEAMNDLNESTGFVANYSADALETQVMLTKQFGLTGKEAAGIYELSVLTGKSSSQVNDNMVGAFVNTRNQLRAGVPFKAVMAEAAKVSGQLAANLGNNPSQIVKAVTQAKALGTTLEQVKNQGEALLNFETSLENELKAELLTGKQLNLERARAAALTGDQVALAEELNKNVGSLEEFQGMNVLQQKALAEAVGLTADELADQLRKQKLAQESGKSLAQITKEEALEAEKRQAVQDKFNQAVLKLQDFFGNLVAGPVGQLLEMLSQALNLINYILTPIQLLFDFAKLIGEAFGGLLDNLGVIGTLLKGIASLAIIYAAYSAYASLSLIPIVGPVLGGIAAAAIAAAGFAMLNSKKGDDVMSEGGYGKRTLLAPEGAIKLNDKDTVIAGTDLGGGGGVGGADKDKGSLGGSSIDITPMVTAINEVKAAVKELMNRPVVINMDSKQVGSSLVQNASYKSA